MRGPVTVLRKSIPFLRGGRLHLRPLRREDAAGPYVEWFNDAVVCAGNGHHDFPYSVQDALAYIRLAAAAKDQLVLAIIRSEDNRHIGNIALKRINFIARSAELAIVIGDRGSWGRGYAREATRLLLNHAFFSLNLNRVYCGTFESNRAMRGLASFLGMKEEGRRRQAAFKRNRFIDAVEYGLLRREYVARFGGPDGS